MKIVGPVQFPLAPLPMGDSIVSTADPFLAAALPFFVAGINTNMSAAVWNAYSNTLATSNASECACLTAVGYDPGVWAFDSIRKMPLLAMFQTKQRKFNRSLMRPVGLETTYEVQYIIPSTQESNADRRVHILNAIPNLFTWLIGNEHDPDGATPTVNLLESTCIDSLEMDNISFGMFENGDMSKNSQTRFPFVEFELTTKSFAMFDYENDADDVTVFSTEINEDTQNPLPMVEIEDPPG